MFGVFLNVPLLGSLSARRAWIEIRCDVAVADQLDVALRKESVDRNKNTLQYEYYNSMSLSARRAWIEMTCGGGQSDQSRCRSPQGERG